MIIEKKKKKKFQTPNIQRIKFTALTRKMISMRAAVNNSKKSKSSTIYTTIAFYIKFAFLGNYALVFWEEENSVSILCGQDVRPHAEIGSQPHSIVDVGSLCNVTMNAAI